ncbi:polysaccharide biosynthesis protein [Neolewinella antarctica]|uniref:O-antigen/teichoic acid export membrane protein n=1 Tax=Neolewinella antarctica TaxID=442734 RepID=A0ABX0XA55_9BACT|nr:hypothetical protein [Neolewinella antarctica]NJC26110.1 O-antigen/teichoic acid export membrane protein [Neolewinella antarctica]
MKKFLVDAGSNYIVYGLQLLIGLFSIPVYLNAYGEELYGVYLLSIGLASTLMVLEFGSGKALARYVAEFREDNNVEKYGLALKTCGTITIVSSLLIGCIFFILAFGRGYVFNISPKFSDDAFWLLSGAGIYSIILLIGQLSQSMLKGAGVFFRRNVLAVWQLLVQALLLGLVYFYSLSIYGLMVGMILLLLISVLLDLITIRKEAAYLVRFDLVRNVEEKSIIDGEIWKYAKETFYLSVVNFFTQNSDQLIIAFFLDVKYVTIYTIITKPYNVIKSLISKGAIILLPHYVRINISQGRKVLDKFAREGGRMMGLLLAMVIGPSIVLLPLLIELWLGTHQYAEYVVYGQLLLGATILKNIPLMIYQALYFVGETKRLFRIEVIVVSINLTTSLILINTIGVGGVILGTCLQILVSAPLLLYRNPNSHLHEKSKNKGIYRDCFLATFFVMGMTAFSVLMEGYFPSVTNEKIWMLLIVCIITACLIIFTFKGFIERRILLMRNILRAT